MTLTVEVQHERWLAAEAGAWDALVAAAGIDPLFNGGLWQTLWWRCHGARLGAALHVYVVRDGADLVAVLPTFRRTVRVQSLFAVTRVEVLGSCLYGDGCVFSEYLDAAVRPGYAQAAADVLAEHLGRARDWGEFVCANTPTDSWLATHLAPRLAAGGSHQRTSAETRAWGVPLAAGADVWKAQLTGPVRRKVFGVRKRLVRPQLQMLDAAGLPGVLALLDRFHQARWGKPHFVGEVGMLYRRLLAARPELARPSLLLHDGQPVSALFDLVVGGREYNVQSGFALEAVPGVSLGYLHLGYAIEAAAGLGVSHFDLLGGAGKQRNYKQDIATATGAMRVVHVVRSAPLARLYRWWDARASAHAQVAVGDE